MAGPVNRRKFIGILGAAPVVLARPAAADHRVVSADPLEVVSDLGSVRERYTPVADFYVRNHYRFPGAVPQTPLRIEGAVEQPKEITPGDLAKLDQRRIGAVLECAGNPVSTAGLVSNGLWEGWPLEQVLSLARPKKSSAHLHLFGRDGYSRSVPLERVTKDALLAVNVNRRPLDRNLGAPWRAIFPGWYGMDAVKWLERIVVADAPLPQKDNTYLEMRSKGGGQFDFSPLPRLRIKSIIVEPVDGSVVPRAGLRVRGLAWTGEGTVVKVEVSGDGGNRWHAANLDSAGPYDWALWDSNIEVNRTGPLELVSRATDSAGRFQPDQRDPDRLDGYANNWCHRVKCVVV